MKFKSIDKVLEGKYINRYDITYETEEGNTLVYEAISRRKDMDSFEKLTTIKPDAVVMIIHDESGERVLLNREFRLAVGRPVYNFPAGLIDPGESYEEAARREIWEETGLELIAIDDVMNLSFSAVGFSNESNICIVGRARGGFRKSSSDAEEIEAKWYTREELRQVMKHEYFAARTQSYCYLWSRE